MHQYACNYNDLCIYQRIGLLLLILIIQPLFELFCSVLSIYGVVTYGILTKIKSFSRLFLRFFFGAMSTIKIILFQLRDSTKQQWCIRSTQILMVNCLVHRG